MLKRPAIAMSDWSTLSKYQTIKPLNIFKGPFTPNQACKMQLIKTGMVPAIRNFEKDCLFEKLFK